MTGWQQMRDGLFWPREVLVSGDAVERNHPAPRLADDFPAIRKRIEELRGPPPPLEAVMIG